MARPPSKHPTTRALNRLEDAGFVACAAGVALLLLPPLAGKFPWIAVWASGLTLFGGLALALGVVLLGLRQWAKPAPSKSNVSRAAGGKSGQPQRYHRNAQAANTARAEPQWSSDAAPSACAAQAPAASERAASLKRPSAWSPEMFAAIEWRQFEAVCEALFAQPGLETLSESHGAEGGFDVWLHNRHAKDPVGVVRCKHGQGKAVGVKDMGAFCSVMTLHQLQRGTYATASTYTASARQFAEANSITALDGADLLKLIAARTPQEQQALLRIAFDGNYWRPTCANCGTKMVERTPSNGGARFWGCSDYPRCKLRLPMVENLRELSLLIE